MTLLEVVLKNWQPISAFIAVIVSCFGIIKYFQERSETHFWKEFEIYHKLVKELVQPPKEEDKMLYVDRQTAVLYELKYFKRYYPHTLRMLLSLQGKWATVPNQFPRILEELNLTINYLQRKTSSYPR